MGGAGSEGPAISVVVPTYNRAAFLPAMLESVFAQRDCPPFEVVLVDDASTDDTAGVVASTGHPVTLVRLEKNGGVARARQVGVERSRGALLAFHDSDDVMLPGRLGELAAYLEGHPELGAVFSNGVIETADGRSVGTVVPEAQAVHLDGRRIGIRDILRDGLPVYLQTALIRRSAFDRAGDIDASLKRHADLDLACRVSLTTPVAFVDRPAFRYRLHGANQTLDRMRLREGLAEVMGRLRKRHPEAVELCGADWYRWREARHLRRIALQRLREARVLTAASIFARSLAIGVRRPPPATGLRAEHGREA
ncbi:MAG TPA: glycosyltransferase [Candidatus Eisenbacteria bacterium]|nr:glycosyltransferase [Candidatus Eisenbacteria bacterium]